MEKYGEVPKVFSAAWWEYFWDYYKWHTIIGIAALMLIIFAVSNCAANITEDVTISYVNYIYPEDSGTMELEEELSALVDDLNGDGKQAVSFLRLIVADTQSGIPNTAEISAMQQRVSAEFAAGQTHVFLMTYNQLPALIFRDDNAELLISLDKHAEGFDESMLIRDNDGVVRAISVQNNKLLKKYNIDTTDMYIVMRNVRYDENGKEEKKQQYEEGRKVMEYIINASK